MKMRRVRYTKFAAAIGILILIASPQVMSSDLVKIIGTVNRASQFVSDNGEFYEIAETIKGEELAGEIDARVEVQGIVEEHDGVLVIKVIDFKELPDDS